jgi:hypothetical protein
MSCLEEGKAPDPRLGVSGELAAASMVAHKPPAVALWRSMGLEVDINGKKWSQGSQIVEFQIILPCRRYFFRKPFAHGCAQASRGGALAPRGFGSRYQWMRVVARISNNRVSNHTTLWKMFFRKLFEPPTRSRWN